ncbi:uncharacterized protein I303_101684 [Kwoniella dejecticola CBS 10117]|uniref:Uncharacterized protein n=1 Tax=Kwoniella dejecticola CBS 10117 TaxID=1296121 RepID=A0A1A6AD34_9TREE|nr:uncharacterized protein I303_02180 [Kwoniella dejecticola CBS 10117]OBR87964.1 hypothetical protein I303_02180 [Kwoniella dejecticola CBS 10117]
MTEALFFPPSHSPALTQTPPNSQLSIAFPLISQKRGLPPVTPQPPPPPTLTPSLESAPLPSVPPIPYTARHPPPPDTYDPLDGLTHHIPSTTSFLISTIEKKENGEVWWIIRCWTTGDGGFSNLDIIQQHHSNDHPAILIPPKRKEEVANSQLTSSTPLTTPKTETEIGDRANEEEIDELDDTDDEVEGREAYHDGEVKMPEIDPETLKELFKTVDSMAKENIRQNGDNKCAMPAEPAKVGRGKIELTIFRKTIYDPPKSRPLIKTLLHAQSAQHDPNALGRLSSSRLEYGMDSGLLRYASAGEFYVLIGIPGAVTADTSDRYFALPLQVVIETVIDKVILSELEEGEQGATIRLAARKEDQQLVDVFHRRRMQAFKRKYDEMIAYNPPQPTRSGRLTEKQSLPTNRRTEHQGKQSDTNDEGAERQNTGQTSDEEDSQSSESSEESDTSSDSDSSDDLHRSRLDTTNCRPSRGDHTLNATHGGENKGVEQLSAEDEQRQETEAVSKKRTKVHFDKTAK